MKTNRALHNLFVHLVKTRDHNALAYLVVLLVSDQRAMEIDWSDRVIPNQELRETYLEAAKETVHKIQGMNKVEVQNNISDLMLAAGQVNGPNDPLVEKAMELGLAHVVARWAVAQGWQDNPALLATAKKLGIPTIVAMYKGWRDLPKMEPASEQVFKHLSQEAWLNKGISLTNFRLARNELVWTTQEADNYFTNIVWPSYKNRQNSFVSLDLALDKEASSDSKPLILAVSEEAWKKVLFSLDYNKKNAQIFEWIDHLIKSQTLELKTPIPETTWMFSYLADFFDELNGRDSVLGQGHFQLRVAQQYHDKCKKLGWSWQDAGLVLGALHSAWLVANRTEKIPLENYELYQPTLEAIEKHLLGGTAPGYADIPQPESYALAAAHWIRKADIEKLEEACQFDTPVGRTKEKTDPGVEFFHRTLALAHYDRLMSDPNPIIGKILAGGYWHHMLNSLGTFSIPKIKNVLALPQDEQACLWQIAKGDERVAAAVAKVRPKIKQSGGASKVAMSKVVLRLETLLAGVELDPKQGSTKPKM